MEKRREDTRRVQEAAREKDRRSREKRKKREEKRKAAQAKSRKTGNRKTNGTEKTLRVSHLPRKIFSKYVVSFLFCSHQIVNP